MIAIIDYDVGNISAVANMLRRVNAPCTITAQADVLEQADRIILPGNGSYDACMRNLRATGLLPVLEQKVLGEGVPLLGICVGAQMLGQSSEEGKEPGLGWLDMKVRRFPEMPGMRIPHMGWNQVVTGATPHSLVQDLQADARFYFVHSYYLDPAAPAEVMLTAQYGIPFAAGVAKRNIYGVQFHPEKSHRFGKQLLSAFAKGA
ncbi:imidazole glycerol phosphate synthase subunit HisH [Pusillimonas sp. CC-YST705]|uniref:Imidazole glycerol phosphate synthase subunit HisH n=1 Tax=Mesopusillimonas faecipullorum TaxID=2755040 RepID=A0ABS8CB47_9BURK|nr:imidazole glycerol phosphate synthase subunit HisH [Mesopusillimonas faecipullorum]MCB5363233.1 imidazole glycerol phosphate synthase subunit HisH [Mesopusillimonas faecipullorum]